MAKIIKPERLGAELRKAMDKHKDLTEARLNKALKITAIKVWGDIIMATPVDSGRARGNWFVGLSVSDQTSEGSKNKGPGFVAKELPEDLVKQKVFLYNNLPYINKLEFGGYSQGLGSTDKTNSQGFSKQAPQGMVRVSLLNWGPTLQKVFKAV